MKFAYKFSNLLGTVYKCGNLIFTPDGNSVISPVGNRISMFDLKNNKSETLPVESQMNITAIALSPDGNLAIVVNEEGAALLISLISRSILHHFHFHRPVNAIYFSPDGKKFAVTKENTVQVYFAPGKTKEFNPFALYRTFYGAYDETVCIDWTSDSKAFAVGGKDMNTRVYGAQKFKNLIIYSLGGHTDSIVGAFFEQNSLDLYTVSRNGQLCIWESDTDPSGLVLSEDSVAMEETGEETDKEEEKRNQAEAVEESMSKDEGKVLFKRLAKHNFKEARGEGAARAMLTAAAFHKPTHILVTGFEDGAFFLHEMPDFNMIHSLSISDQSISTMAFNKTGEWLAIGCAAMGQLLVWEWQSESFILKQQGHFNNMSCLEYSPDGQYIATGGEDGKVKMWNTSSGFCFVTFSEHISAITGVCFSQNGQVVVSASRDGTVRAFDLNRYRNFRTFTSPRPVQFASLALDRSGEVVCAGGMDVFEIFVWSMQTGRLLDVIAGHEGPISSLSFCPVHSILVSTSWDHTMRFWNVFRGKGAKEGIQLSSDALAVAYRPDGAEVAVATLDGQITIWNPDTAVQLGSIEGRPHLGYGRKEGEKITGKTSGQSKAFNTLCYTADGKCILAGGQSKYVCIYSVAEQILIKRFEITCNLSFDGTQEFLDRRKMTEFGSLSLVEEGQGEDGRGTSISLPGVKKGDMSSRHWKPEVRVTAVRFSPTGRAWSATTTEGLLVYSLDHNLVFDPFDLDMDIVPENVDKSIKEKEYTTALMLAFRLNEQHLIQKAVENIPVADVDYVAKNLPDVYVDKMLDFIGGQLESTRHIQFYIEWAQKLMLLNGPKIKSRSQSLSGCLQTLQKNLTSRLQDLGKICDQNKYSLQYILSLAETRKKQPPKDEVVDSKSDDEITMSDSDDDFKMLVNDENIQQL